MNRVTTQNRLKARKLLSVWHNAADVRNWTLADLNVRLAEAVVDGLITQAAVDRALNAGSDAPATRPTSGDANNGGAETGNGSDTSDDNGTDDSITEQSAFDAGYRDGMENETPDADLLNGEFGDAYDAGYEQGRADNAGANAGAAAAAGNGDGDGDASESGESGESGESPHFLLPTPFTRVDFCDGALPGDTGDPARGIAAGARSQAGPCVPQVGGPSWLRGSAQEEGRLHGVNPAEHALGGSAIEYRPPRGPWFRVQAPSLPQCQADVGRNTAAEAPPVHGQEGSPPFPP